MEEIELSKTHYLILDCPLGIMRPNKILEILLEQLINSEMNINDFKKVYSFCGEWKFILVKSKEKEFEKNMKQIIRILETLYDSGYIRYAEYYPN
jgi:hypothetical protein